MRRLCVFAIVSFGCADLDGDGALDARDCAPDDAAIHPDAEEVCDGIDNNCSGQVDEDVAFVAYWDRDLDGWGDEAYARRVCTLPADGSLTAGDCDDFDPTIHPDAPELCNLADENCDNEIDEGLSTTFYADADGDGHGDASAPTTDGCFVPDGYTERADDCDDGNAHTYPGAAELCDGADNDCDLSADEDLTTTRVWADLDGDGYGDPSSPTLGCGTGSGVADNDLDCDDLDPNVSPDAIDVRGDALDMDCDGYVDEYGVGPGNEFATVEDALASAPNGAVVQLDAGFFVGTIDLRGYDITFAGEGCDRTTWYADSSGSAVIVDTGRVEGMTISGGAGSYEDDDQLVGGGVVVAGDAALASLCIQNNAADAGGGIAVVDGTAEIDGVLVLRNTSVGNGGGIYVGNTGEAHVVRSRLIANVAGGRGGGIQVTAGTAEVTNTVIAANQASRWGAGASGSPVGTDEADLTFDQVTFHANQSVQVVDAKGQAFHLEGGGPSAYHKRGELHNVLITDHPRDFTMVESSKNALLTKEYVGYRANVGPDADYEIPQPDRIGKEYAFILYDPALAPEQWDLRMRSASQFIDVGDPAFLDPDGTTSDLGAYGGPDAPADWDYGMTVDDDGDGMLSGWEIHNGLNPFVEDRSDDADGDGVRNGDEASAGTDPQRADSDEDGVDDATEIALRTLPRDPRDQAPAVDAGTDRWSLVGEPVWIDGRASRDPNNDSLSFTWSLTSLPPFSALTLASPTAARTSIVPDVPGEYAVSLEVSDGKTSRTATIVVHAFDGPVVPDDAPSLVEALTLASPGQAIGVRPGLWPAVLDLGAEAPPIIGLIGEGTSNDVVLDGEGRGSVLQAEGTLTVAHVTLEGGYAVGGGGVRVESATEITLADVVIRENLAAEGGGVWVTGEDTQLRLEDVQLIENTATAHGGGLFVEGYFEPDTLLAYRVLFAGNRAIQGGALFSNGGSNKSPYPSADSNFLLDACTFVGNSALSGAVFFHSGMNSELYLFNDTFAGNQGASLGIAVDGRVVVASDIVLRNTVDVLWDGTVEIQHHQGVWDDVPDVVFGEGVTGLSADLETWIEVDPLNARFTDDGDPTDDLWAQLIGSAAVDGGFVDDVDRDGTRADTGACGGRSALGRCQAYGFDADGDTLSDGWESAAGLDPTVAVDALIDHDLDGLDAIAEQAAGTDPLDEDSDEDGFADGVDLDPLDDRDHRPQLVVDVLTIAPQVGSEAVVDASGSFDPDGNPLAFSWSLVTLPPGSALTDTDLTGDELMSFVPDADGTYAFAVTASDGTATSRRQRVWVHVSNVLEVQADGSGPYATVDDAVEAASVGDVVQLGAGEWEIKLAGADFPLTIRGAGRDATVITSTDEVALVDVGEFDQLTLQDLTLDGGVGAFGGAVRCDTGTLVLERVRITRSVAHEGGGAYLADCTATFRDVDVVGNFAGSSGGGIFALGGTLDWVGGVVSGNLSELGGGGLHLGSAVATVRNVVFVENRALYLGSAIEIENESGRPDGSLVAEYLTVVRNRTATAGAIARRVGSPLTLRYSIIADNEEYGVNDLPFMNPNLVLERNLYWGNEEAATYPGTLVDAEDLQQDPQLATLAGDLRLMHTSPARDVGPELDPDGSLADLGAFGGPAAPPDFDHYFLDEDVDGMTDQWELANGLDPSFDDAGEDPDLDLLPNALEYEYLTDPYQEDSDGDGAYDWDELLAGTDPMDPLDHAPDADAGTDQVADLDVLVVLDGSASDLQGDALTLRWTLLEKPGRSALVDDDLTGADTAQVSFTPDVAGAYILGFSADDGTAAGPLDTVTVTVTGEVLVPEDYPTIQRAVEAAPTGSTIRIGPGAWPAHLDVAGKDLTFVGAGDGPDGTVLDGADLGPVLLAVDVEQLAVQDLTIAAGRGARGGGLWFASGPRLDLDHVAFEENVAAEGGALYLDSFTGEVYITGCRFVDNRVGYRGGAISAIDTKTIDIAQTLFAGNRALNDFGGALRIDRGDTTLTNVVLSDNSAKNAGAIFITGLLSFFPIYGDLTLDHVTATYNSVTSSFGSFLKSSVAATVVVTNSIIASHSGPAAVDGLGDSNTYTQSYTLLADNDVDFRLPAGTAPTPGIDGNLTAAVPGFTIASADGDWTNESWLLDATSAAVDSADPLTGNDPDDSLPDMGAFGGPSGSW